MLRQVDSPGRETCSVWCQASYPPLSASSEHPRGRKIKAHASSSMASSSSRPSFPVRISKRRKRFIHECVRSTTERRGPVARQIFRPAATFSPRSGIWRYSAVLQRHRALLDSQSPCPGARCCGMSRVGSGRSTRQSRPVRCGGHFHVVPVCPIHTPHGQRDPSPAVVTPHPFAPLFARSAGGFRPVPVPAEGRFGYGPSIACQAQAIPLVLS